MRPILCIALAASLPGCIIPVPVEHETLDFDVTEPITAVEVQNTTGDVIVRGGDVPTAVEAELSWHGDEPEVTVDVRDGTLFVETDCQDPSWFCSVDLTLDVPRAVTTTVDVTTGDVTVREVDGAVDVETTTGDLALAALPGAVYAATTTGHVVGSRLAGDTVEVFVTTGDVDLVHVGEFVEIDAETTTGWIELLVPAGTYDIVADNTTGDIEILGVIDDPAAPSSIRAHTTTGDIQITGYTVVDGD